MVVDAPEGGIHIGGVSHQERQGSDDPHLRAPLQVAVDGVGVRIAHRRIPLRQSLQCRLRVDVVHHAGHAVQHHKGLAVLLLHLQHLGTRVDLGDQAGKDIPLARMRVQPAINACPALGIVGGHLDIVFHDLQLRHPGLQSLACQILVAHGTAQPARAVTHAVKHFHLRLQARQGLLDEMRTAAHGLGHAQHHAAAWQGLR